MIQERTTRRRPAPGNDTPEFQARVHVEWLSRSKKPLDQIYRQIREHQAILEQLPGITSEQRQ